jgi:hypothetical protein
MKDAVRNCNRKCAMEEGLEGRKVSGVGRLYRMQGTVVCAVYSVIVMMKLRGYNGLDTYLGGGGK